MSKVMVLGGEAFRRCFNHEGRTLLNVASALTKGTPKSPSLIHQVKTQKEGAGDELGN